MSTFNSFTNYFGIHPIIQAPMAGVSTPKLAAAVSNAGGLGSLGLGASTVDQAIHLIDETYALTDRPFNVNVFCHTPAQKDSQSEEKWLRHLEPLFLELGAETPKNLSEIYKSFLDQEDMLHMLINKKPAIVSFHFGLPPIEWVNKLRSAGIYTLATATNIHEAKLIEKFGIDAIVAQGIEAGGHRGIFNTSLIDEGLNTAALVRELVESTNLPIIASGGIMNGQSIKAMLDLGAVAAQLGTAFLLCPESNANDGYRAALKSNNESVTKMTNTLSGRPARGITNRFIDFCEAQGSPLPPSYPIAYDVAKQLMSIATKQNNYDFSAFWAGQGVSLIREMPAAQLVSKLLEELDASYS